MVLKWCKYGLDTSTVDSVMYTFSQMAAEPQFWLPLTIPVVFGVLAVIFHMATPVDKTKNSAYLYLGMVLTNICFAYLAIDLWALTTSISIAPQTGVYRRDALIALSILFLLIHLLLYALCLLAMNEYRSGNSKGRLWGLSSPAWAVILTLVGVVLALVERIRVFRVFLV